MPNVLVALVALFFAFVALFSVTPHNMDMKMAPTIPHYYFVQKKKRELNKEMKK